MLKAVRKKINRNPIIKNYTSKKALVPPAEVHVRVADANVVDSLSNAISIVLYELGVFCARRKMEVHDFITENITYESTRHLGIELKPRVIAKHFSKQGGPHGDAPG